MTTFKYTAKKGPEEIRKGFVEAPHQDVAVNKVIQLGLTPIDVVSAQDTDRTQSSPKKDINLSKPFLKKIRRNDTVLFTRQIADLTDASVPLLKSIQIVLSQTRNPHFKERVEKIQIAVKAGRSLSQALAQHTDIFSNLYINLIATGEIGGHLEKVLNRLANLLEKERESRNKIKSSLAYPAVILAVGFLTVFVLLSFVIPRLSIMFDDIGQSLPLPTIILMNISSIFAHYWWLLISIFVGIGIYFKQWTDSVQGRRQYDQFKLRIPLLGNFIKIVETARFARTLGTLVENGVTITEALNSVWAVIDNTVLREEIKQISQEVTNGSSLRDALGQSTFFPEIAVNMISIGEETGRLDRGLYKIADTFERQADQNIKTVISLLGPLILILIVSIVGFVVVAMLLPIFQMNLLVQ